MQKRIHQLDFLRGFAVMGILIMNINAFAQIGLAYFNPYLGAGIEGYNKYVWNFNYLFADGRFMAIFSMLFGAGLYIFAERLEMKNLAVARHHYRRMFFLLIFGFIHAYLIWAGDILVAYSICGCLIFLIRKWSTPILLLIALFLFSVPILLGLTDWFTATADQQEFYRSIWNPSAESIARQVDAFRGGYLQQMPQRIAGAIELQTFIFLIDRFWFISAMMIFGILLYRSKILTGERSISFYRNLAIVGILTGVFISYFGLRQSYAYEWDGFFVLTFGGIMNYLASAFMGLGYIALIYYAYHFKFLQTTIELFKKVGKLAFTNYILMSILGTFVYYGHGFGLFATHNRMQQIVVLLIIWAIILIYSHRTFTRYRQGPLENLWRRLTYWKF